MASNRNTQAFVVSLEVRCARTHKKYYEVEIFKKSQQQDPVFIATPLCLLVKCCMQKNHSNMLHQSFIFWSVDDGAHNCQFSRALKVTIATYLPLVDEKQSIKSQWSEILLACDWYFPGLQQIFRSDKAYLGKSSVSEKLQGLLYKAV